MSSNNKPLPEPMLTKGDNELKSQKTPYMSPWKGKLQGACYKFMRKLTMLWCCQTLQGLKEVRYTIYMYIDISNDLTKLKLSIQRHDSFWPFRGYLNFNYWLKMVWCIVNESRQTDLHKHWYITYEIYTGISISNSIEIRHYMVSVKSWRSSILSMM